MRKLQFMRLTGAAVVIAGFLSVFGCGAALAGAGRSAADEAYRHRIDAVYDQQRARVDAVLHALKPQRPGVRDLYFVGVAGFGDEEVFRKEVEHVRQLFDARFDTGGHSVVLINNPATLERYPLATPETLNRVLRGIGQQFDRQEDVLFLFVTSHGLPRRGFITGLAPYSFGFVTPRSLEHALDAAGIRNRVILVSACYSGQFVPALKGEDTLVITASAADRPSFGCTPRADWTWFSESYFVEALPKDGKFEQAFYDARKAVKRREHAGHIRPSRPQMAIGRAMQKLLQELGH